MRGALRGALRGADRGAGRGPLAASRGALGPAWARRAPPLGSPAAPQGPCGRAFGTTDGPFRHIKPKFVEKKRHYNEVLVMADVRKLIETTQDVLDQPAHTFPKGFWEVLAKRCLQSMHLLQPLELALVARAFDLHGVELRSKLDVYGAIAQRARALHDFPGLAILVLVDVLPRRLKAGTADLSELLRKLSRRAADAMYELSPSHAVRLLESLTAADIRDPALCARVSGKVAAQLAAADAGADAPALGDLASAAAALAGQGHRDIPALFAIADAVAGRLETAPEQGCAVEAAERVLGALNALGVDAPEVVERLQRASSLASETSVAA